jgi:hypothetical protein
MDNPFEEILSELKAIKLLISSLRIAQPREIEIIDRAELRKRLEITEPTVIRWQRRGDIPFMLIGTCVRYNWPEVVKALEKRESNATQDIKAYNTKRRKKEIDELDDRYIKTKLHQATGLSFKEMPREVLDLKKVSLKLKREIRDKKQNNK